MGQAINAAIAPSSNRPSISPTDISLNTSSQTNSAAISSTGTSAIDQSTVSARIMAAALQYLQRCQPLGPSIDVSVAKPVTHADRENHWQPHDDREAQV